MFDLVPNLLALPTVLLPIFASYKALNTNDISQLTPWMMYWVVLACFTLVESWTWWIVSWVPFYAWMRLFFLLYLSLPQTQGAKMLYLDYIHPQLRHHEHDIEDFVARTHEQAMSYGLRWLKHAVVWVQDQLGMDTRPPTPPPQSTASYAQGLFSRFSMPSVGGMTSPPASAAAAGIYSFLSQRITPAAGSSTSREVQIQNLTASGTLIPAEMKTQDERMGFIRAQRERLQVVLSALDREALTVGGLSDKSPTPPTGITKNVSEENFERVEKEEIASGVHSGSPKAAGWIPWGWSGRSSQPSTPHKEEPPAVSVDHPKGSSSGVDL